MPDQSEITTAIRECLSAKLLQFSDDDEHSSRRPLVFVSSTRKDGAIRSDSVILGVEFAVRKILLAVVDEDS